MRRRAFNRPLKPILLTLLLTAAVVGHRARKTRTYGSRVVFRVSEGDLDAATAPAPKRQLRQYILDVAFSAERLLGVIQAHGLYARELSRGPDFAVEAMRDDLDVEVWRNYFLEQRGVEDAGRSARIGITYVHKDRRISHAVVQHLGRLVVEQEAQSRVAMAEEAVQVAKLAAEQMRDDLARRRGLIKAKEMASRRAPTTEAAMLRLEVAALVKGLDPLELKLKELQQKKSALELRAAMERAQMGLRFELIDPGQVAKAGLSKPRQLALIGIITLILVLPLAGIATAAFDSRIYDGDDVRRLGLRLVGHIEAFAGDNRGALKARLARDHRVH